MALCEISIENLNISYIFGKTLVLSIFVKSATVMMKKWVIENSGFNQQFKQVIHRTKWIYNQEKTWLKKT